MKELLQKQCKTCEKVFYTRSINSKYCGKECRPDYSLTRVYKTYSKICKYCQKEFTTTDNRVTYCNLKCATKHTFNSRKNAMRALILKNCEHCGTEINMLPNQRFCCKECKAKNRYQKHIVPSETQYKNISGNWKQYFLRLIHQHGRKKDGLTRDYLLELLEKQNGKCALTGVELTCKLEKGVKCKTNASIDRIDAGGNYTPENVQLVCRAVNSFRTDCTIEEFIDWCKKVVDHNPDPFRDALKSSSPEGKYTAIKQTLEAEIRFRDSIIEDLKKQLNINE